MKIDITQKSGFLLGLFSVYAQTMMLRELFAVYGFSEILVASILFFWLFWGALGSFFFRRGSIAAQFAFFGAFGILLPVIVKATAIVFRTEFGLITPLWNVAGAGFISSLPAFFGGRAFAALAKSKAAHKIYAFEGLGAFAGGILSILFIGTFNKSIFILAALSLALVISSAGWKAALRYFLAIAIVTIALTFSPKLLEKILWKDFDVSMFESYYGRIAVLTRMSENYIYLNGKLIASQSDSLSSEQVVHPIMWAHRNPEKVLLMGGLYNGAIRDILKHEPQSLVLPFADKIMLQTAITNFPSLRNYLSGEQISIIESDPRVFIHKDSARYDIILNMPGFPSSGADNRFWTIEFFAKLSERLADSGIVAVALPVGANYLSDYQRELCASAWKSFKSAFPDGESYFLDGAVLFVGANVEKFSLSERLQALPNLRHIETVTLPLGYLPILFQSRRGETLERQLESAQFARINRDWQPQSYFWGILEQAMLSGVKIPVNIFKNGQRKFLIAIFVILLLAIVFGFIFRRSSPFAYVIGGGMWGMFSQTLFLFLLQANFGSLYWLIGFATGVFLLGGSAGSLLGGKFAKKANFALFPIFTVICAIVFLGSAGYNIPLAVFLFLFLFSGGISGLVFGSATSFVSKQIKKKSDKSHGGKVYGAELAGAAIGTLGAMFAIPVSHPLAIVGAIAIVIMIIGWRSTISR